MRRFMLSRSFTLALGLAIALPLVTPASAQSAQRQRPRAPSNQVAPSPAPALDLKAHDTRADRAAVSEKSLAIASLMIRVDIVGGLAETTLTARFTNPNDAILEGDFSLSLPREAYVTGFALDVNGVLVDGVLQPKAKAAEAYEENLRRGVDPGLGEINDANQFRTRIFPINARSGRTVRIKYVSTLDASGAYVLPLTTAGPVGQVEIKITNNGNARPTVTLPRGLSAQSGNGAGNGQGIQDGYGQTIASYQGQNIQLRGDLRFSNGGREDDLTVTIARQSEQYFTFVAPPAPVTTAKPKIIRLYWDASRSRRDDDLAKEITLLERYVAQAQPDRVDVVLFADTAPRTFSLTRATLGTLAAKLRDVRYQGASRFGALERAGQGDADLCLLFSDGQLTVDAFGVRQWPCRVMTVSTSTNARRDILEGIADANRGAFIDLKTASITNALAALQTRGPDLRSLETGSGAAVDYTVTPMTNGQFRITGPRPDADDLIVKTYGAERRFSIRNAISVGHNGAATLWGASQIKRLSATDNPDTDALLALVRRFGVATPDYSYIVLESVEDYAINNIAPSDGIGKEFLVAYRARRTQIEAQERAAKDARLQTILGQWNEQKTWWKTRFSPQAQTKIPANSNGVGTAIDGAAADAIEGASPSRPRNAPGEAMEMPAPAPLPSPTAPAPASEPLLLPSPPPPLVERRTSAIVAPNDTRARAGRAATQAAPQQGSFTDGAAPQGQQAIQSTQVASNITVSTATWNPNRPYINALQSVKSGDVAAFDAIYQVQEVQFGTTPAFYFDMAEWAYRNGLQSRAADIARNALELNNTTINTKIILASRLVRYGDYDRAIWLNERILQATPNKPQALRNLALSIIDATDAMRTRPNVNEGAAIANYERALGLLMKIVLTPNADDYDGIELIALMEANHVAAKLKRLGVGEARLAELMDVRLISLLAVDIRVTLEWNTDKTDMDLWVDEPTGERAIFNNPRTAIGGRLSNDMTGGYGPEEYLLNVAPNGLYKVLSNAYASDRLDPNGPTSLTVRLYRDWGRPTEKVESFVVELNRGQQNATTEIGQFVKGPQ
jgi:hypothetical protein